MNDVGTVALVAMIGLATTSSCMLGAALGLYVPIQKRVLACVLAFAAGSLICALAIDLAFSGAQDLHSRGFQAGSAWAFVGGGFALGAVIYYLTSLFLDQKGAAVRSPARFRDYVLGRKQKDSKDLIALLAKCDLLRHLPPNEIENLLPLIGRRRLANAEILFRAGDPGDALYIVARGVVEVLLDDQAIEMPGKAIAQLGEGHAFGEMALLSGQPRTATIRAVADTELLEIRKADFERLVGRDRQMARAVERLSHERAITNLAAGGTSPSRWADVARNSVHHVTRDEADRLLAETGKGAGLAIVLGNILDTIPGCLVIGAKFTDFSSISLTLMLGMFLGGIPEAAASGAMLTRAGFTPRAIFGLWSTVLLTGLVATAAGKLLLGGTASPLLVFDQGVAGGATLAVVTHAMIPEAIHDGRSLIVLPTVARFLFALYLRWQGVLGSSNMAIRLTTRWLVPPHASVGDSGLETPHQCRSRRLSHLRMATDAQTVSIRPNGHAPCKKP
jgi:CRP-like cAMP-binding protein